MRVALVGAETGRGGDSAGSRRFQRVARLLAEAGHDVTVLCTRWWDDSWRLPEENADETADDAAEFPGATGDEGFAVAERGQTATANDDGGQSQNDEGGDERPAAETAPGDDPDGGPPAAAEADGDDPAESVRDVYEVNGVTYRAVTADAGTTGFAARLPVALLGLRPDVIHVRPAPPAAVVAAGVGGTLVRAPVVVDWFGDEGVGESRTADWAVRAADHVITPSELVRTRVRERGVATERTSVVPESIDMDRVRELDPEDGVDVAFAGHLDGNANLEHLLLALAELREKDWTATVIGDGPERSAYERQAADLRIDDRVDFVGNLGRRRRVAVYKGAHAFVQTAYRELFATELLWALACGCVGIVEYQAESSAHELIEQRERSFRVTSTEQIADAIVDAGEYDHLTVDERFAEYDHESVRERYENRYERVVDEFGLLG